MLENIRLEIQNTNILSAQDKNFLISGLEGLNPLQRLKLQQALQSGHAETLLQILNQLRASVTPPQQNPDNQASPGGFLQKASNLLAPKKQPEIIHASSLLDANYLGMEPVKAKPLNPNLVLQGLGTFSDLSQLQLLHPSHIYFNLNQNFEQELNNFLGRLDELFEPIEDLEIRRMYLMNYIQSKLFNSYISTGLTALKHPELQPSKIVLNLLHQINSVYLNNRQFRHASIITNHVRGLCGI